MRLSKNKYAYKLPDDVVRVTKALQKDLESVNFVEDIDFELLAKAAIAAMGNVQSLNTSEISVQKSPENEHMEDASTRKDEGAANTAFITSSASPSEIRDNLDTPIGKLYLEYAALYEVTKSSYNEGATDALDKALQLMKPVSVKDEREDKIIEAGLKREYEQGYDVGYKQGFKDGVCRD